MSCVRGFVLAVAEKVRAAYLESATFNWPLFRNHGATAHWECWEAGVPEGAVTPSRWW
ncbi:DUF1428 family protein [Sagittula salina]|uniref:DUF1428 family protein n=1 Tax=Sagittula salina TaxID=2820268 RepID=UPI0024742FB4|nr:DUF1428 family protein [Sagittula salina]